MRASRRSPSTPHHIGLGVLAGVTWLGASLPGGADWFFLCPIAWGLAGLGWLAWFVGCLAGRAITREAGWWSMRGWAVGPFLAVMTIVFVGAGWPLELRFRLGRAALEADARSALSAPADDPLVRREESWLGSYWVRRRMEAGIVEYWVSGSGGLMGWGGFAYSPKRAPATAWWDLGGGWYVWVHST